MGFEGCSCLQRMASSSYRTQPPVCERSEAKRGEFPQGLKPGHIFTLYGTANQSRALIRIVVFCGGGVQNAAPRLGIWLSRICVPSTRA